MQNSVNKLSRRQEKKQKNMSLNTNTMSEVSTSQTVNDSLWDNPMIQKAKKQMSAEELERYKIMGETMYEDLDAVTGDFNPNKGIQEDIENCARRLIIDLRDGLHPSQLTEAEKNILVDQYGTQWYEKFGYEEYEVKEMY